MVDEVDRANEYLDTMTKASIANAQAESKTPVNLTGKCLWCGDSVPDTRRWCSTDCRDEDVKHAK